MTTATYTDYPFTANGVNFISRVFTHSEMAKRIANLPAGVFAQLNQEAVSDLIGDPSLLTTAELLKELESVNDGGSHAFILLDSQVI
jgi:hypothetical protein